MPARTPALVTILDALVSRLAVDWSSTTGPDGLTGTFNLAPTGAVRRGRHASPWLREQPCVCVWLDDEPVQSSTQSDEMGPINLNQYGRAAQILIHGWAPAASRQQKDREDAAIKLQDDIMRALEANRRIVISGARASLDIVLSASMVAADLAGTQPAEVEIRTRLFWRVDTGV